MEAPIMTRFMDVPALRNLIGQVGAAAFMRAVAEAVEADFKRWPDFSKCARVASHSPQGVIELMPVADAQRYGFKYVNGHPHNPARGLSTVMAFGALAEVDSGYPLLLSELTLSTAFRTAATSAVAARALTRPGSRVMGLIGAGAQSEFQCLAFHTLLDIDTIRVFDIDPNASRKLIRNCRHLPGLTLTIARDIAEAVNGADIVTTCTADKTRATILQRAMVAPGMHINAIGGDCPGKTELDITLLECARIVVEFEPQTRLEGEIQQLPGEHPVTELWQVLTGQVAGRRAASDITVFDSVGFALEDFSVLRVIYELAEAGVAGQCIELIPALRDPNDLFG
jgi:ornithine cyclodeaminase